MLRLGAGFAEDTTLPLSCAPWSWFCPAPELTRCPPLSADTACPGLWASLCHGEMSWLLLAGSPKWLADTHGVVLAPGGTLKGRRSGDPKRQAAAVFAASSLQRGLAGSRFIAPSQCADGFHTPVLGVFMDSFPIKRAGG